MQNRPADRRRDERAAVPRRDPCASIFELAREGEARPAQIKTEKAPPLGGAFLIPQSRELAALLSTLMATLLLAGLLLSTLLLLAGLLLSTLLATLVLTALLLLAGLLVRI